MSPGRLCWTILPFLLSLAALLCLVLVFLGNTSAPTSLPHSLYFSSITFQNSSTNIGWQTVGLWNSCVGPANQSFNHPSECDARHAFYHFDLSDWGLNATTTASAFGEGYAVALKNYTTISKWMWIAYIAAIAASGVTFLLSFAGCASRCGSVFTSFAAGITAVLAIAASALATATSIMLKAFFKELNSGFSSELGRPMFITTWLGAALATAAAFSWLFTICCCAGDHKRKTRKEGDYHRVPSPTSHA